MRLSTKKTSGKFERLWLHFCIEIDDNIKIGIGDIKANDSVFIKTKIQRDSLLSILV